MHNDALIYLAVAVATFAAVPSFFWLKDKRHKARERRRNRAVVESLKAKMGAARAMEAARALEAASALEATRVLEVVTPPEASGDDEHEERDAEDAKEKKKRSKDRRKRGRETSRTARSKKPLPSSRAPPEREPPPTEYTPRAPDQSCFSPPPMPDIASPTPVSLIPASFHPPSPSLSRSETSSQPGPSRSTSISPTTAPLTPPSLPASHSLPIVKMNNTEVWAPHLPRSDPAWDWDGQSSTYSGKSTRRDILGNPPSPSMPSAPSLVFPSLNTHPPPGASLATQIASLKGALEASRTREDMHRRDAERWSKECDLVKWRWNEAADHWRRRDSELQAQIHHLVHQLQTLTLSPPVPVTPFSGPGQSPFALAMPFPSHHHPTSPFGGMHPFDHRPASASPNEDTVNEGLAEAILKRPGSMRPAPSSSSSSRSAMRRGGSRNEERRATLEDPEQPKPKPKPKPANTHAEKEEVVEFEFPTLLERRIPSPRGRETVSSVDAVEIFN